MAKPNYQFEKRRRDLEKKAKKDAKRQKKLEAGSAPAPENEATASSPTTPT